MHSRLLSFTLGGEDLQHLFENHDGSRNIKKLDEWLWVTGEGLLRRYQSWKKNLYFRPAISRSTIFHDSWFDFWAELPTRRIFNLFYFFFFWTLHRCQTTICIPVDFHRKFNEPWKIKQLKKNKPVIIFLLKWPSKIPKFYFSKI